MMKYTKRASALVCAILLVLCTSVTVFAEALYKLNDAADIFTPDEDTIIEEQLNEATEITGWEVVIYTNTRNTPSYEMEDVCNNFYDVADFGVGEDKSGVMLTIDMASREMYILTKGDAMYYFDDERLDDILDNVVYYLADDEYYEAAQAFIDDVKLYHSSGKPENGSYSNVYIAGEDEFDGGDVAFMVLIAFGVGLVAAVLSVVFVSLRYKNHGKAGTYDLRSNSTVHLTDKQDIFLHKSVTVHTESSSSGSGRSSGGSRSSSHGGGGRSF